MSTGTHHHDQGGQAVIVLVAVAAALITGAVLLVTVGESASLRVESQSAADAAALAAAEDLRGQLLDSMRFGRPLDSPCDDAQAYAGRNGAELRVCQVSSTSPIPVGRSQREVRVEVESIEQLDGPSADRVGVSGTTGEATARAELVVDFDCDPVPGVDAAIRDVADSLALAQPPSLRDLGCGPPPGNASAPYDSFRTRSGADTATAEDAMDDGAPLCRPYATTPSVFAHRSSRACGGQRGDLSAGSLFGPGLRDLLEVEARLIDDNS